MALAPQWKKDTLGRWLHWNKDLYINEQNLERGSNVFSLSVFMLLLYSLGIAASMILHDGILPSLFSYNGFSGYWDPKTQ